MAGASLQTTAGDYARFLIALGDGVGLTKATWQAMTRAQIQVVGRDDKPCFSWGLGVGVNQSGADTTLWHWGDNGDLNAYFEIIPKRRRGVVFFMNGANAHALSPLITRRVLGIDRPAIATSYFTYPRLDSPAMALTRAFRTRGIGAAIEVAAASPDRVSVTDAEIQRLTALADIAARAGEFAGARAALEFVLKHQPASAPALVSLGGAQLALGDRTAMEASFHKAVEIQPNLEGRINSIGYALLSAGRIDEAIVVFEYNVAKYPQSANCYDSLAEAFEKKGDRRQAIRNYAKALSMADPDPSGSSYQALKRLLNEKQ
jgi:tetratricopeptide (TPR) repeat protein